MRKCLVLLAVCIYSSFSIAQNVGVGVPNPQNKLHVGGGFRLDTLTGVGGAGLLWHNSNGVVYGIKFSGNTNEVLLGDGTFGPYNPAINGALGWLLTGNSGTNPATNFIGTTDDQPLLFKVNNVRHGYLGSSIFFGSEAGLVNTALTNIGIGPGALRNNTIGAENIAIGEGSMFSNIFGFGNTALGRYTLEKNTLGNTNIALGSYALNGNTEGSYNIGIGYLSLGTNTTGIENTGIGNYSLSSNTTGYDNTAIGYFSLISNNGYYNSALGASSLSLNTSGHDNTALGYFAMNGNTTASFNTSVGAFSLQKNSTGGSNTAVGYKSLEQNIEGSSNTAIGLGALQGTKASGNTAIGFNALSSNVTGTSNVAIGQFADVRQSSLVNAIAIGTGAKVGASNSMVLGGTAFNAIKVGIGVEIPISTLHVAGSAKFFDFGANHTGNFWNGTSSSNGVEIISSGNDAYVGIQRASGAGLHISKPFGSIGDMVAFFNSSVVVGTIYSNGITTSYNTTSDSRLKENRRSTQYSLKTLMQIEAEDYNYISDNNKNTQTGFIAQELFKIYPQAVVPGGDDPKTKPWMIDYSKLSPLLVKAVQEQQSMIEKQQKQINDLIKRIEALEKK